MNKKKIKKKHMSYVRLPENTYYTMVSLKCIKCKRIYHIRTTPEHLQRYTPEYKKNYICLICRDDGSKAKWQIRLKNIN